jgi:hypothetical protein
MVGQARVVIPGAPHHVTQRGNHRQNTFFRDADYVAYLRIAAVTELAVVTRPSPLRGEGRERGLSAA